MRLLRPVFRFGIVPHLLQTNQPVPRKLHIKREPLLGLPTGVADLVNLRLGERISMALGRTRRRGSQS